VKVAANETHQSALHQRLQAQADGVHVADDLVGRFLERKEQHALPAPAGGLRKVGRNDRLAGARRPVSKMLLPRKKSLPPASRRAGDAVAIRSVDT